MIRCRVVKQTSTCTSQEIRVRSVGVTSTRRYNHVFVKCFYAQHLTSAHGETMQLLRYRLDIDLNWWDPDRKELFNLIWGVKMGGHSLVHDAVKSLFISTCFWRDCLGQNDKASCDRNDMRVGQTYLHQYSKSPLKEVNIRCATNEFHRIQDVSCLRPCDRLEYVLKVCSMEYFRNSLNCRELNI